MAEWEEQFGSPLLLLLSLGALLTTFGSFIFGQLFTGADGSYTVLLVAFIILSLFLYDKISGGIDLHADINVSDEFKGFAVGLVAVFGVSIILTALLAPSGSATVSICGGAPFCASIWVPSKIVPLAVNTVGSSQYLLDVVVLAFLVAPGEQALIAIGAVFTVVTGLGEGLPLYAQPFMHATVILWATLHVAFGQYPTWFFFVAYPSGIGMLAASHVAGDYAASVGSHGGFDVVLRTIRFLASGQ